MFIGIWLEMRAELPTVSEMVLNILLPFCIVYFCEEVVSVLMIIKFKIPLNSEKH